MEYEYEALHDDELTLRLGDIIKNVRYIEEDGWMEGDLNGKRGLFPDNFVKVRRRQRHFCWFWYRITLTEFAVCGADCELPLRFQMPLLIVVPLEIIPLKRRALSDRGSLRLGAEVTGCSRCGH